MIIEAEPALAFTQLRLLFTCSGEQLANGFCIAETRQQRAQRLGGRVSVMDKETRQETRDRQSVIANKRTSDQECADDSVC